MEIANAVFLSIHSIESFHWTAAAAAAGGVIDTLCRVRTVSSPRQRRHSSSLQPAATTAWVERNTTAPPGCVARKSCPRPHSRNSACAHPTHRPERSWTINMMLRSSLANVSVGAPKVAATVEAPTLCFDGAHPASGGASGRQLLRRLLCALRGRPASVRNLLHVQSAPTPLTRPPLKTHTYMPLASATDGLQSWPARCSA